MKNRSYHKLRRIGWTFVSAGLLGLPAQARAQSPYSPIRDYTTVSGGAEQARPRSRDQQLSREAAINVELAWLSTPDLFPYRLDAYAYGSALQVRGAVPNETLHAEALKLARAESRMPVIDGIQVYSTMVMPPVSKPAQVLSREVNDRMSQALPACMAEMTIQVWTRGQVILKGSVPAHEDKLKASRCLQRLAGCSCVVNQLEVRQAKSLAASGAPSFEKPSIAANEARENTVPLEQVKVLPPQRLTVERVDAAPLMTRIAQPAARNVNVPAAAALQKPVMPASNPVRTETVAKAEMNRPDEKDPSSPLMYHRTKWRKLDGGSAAGPAKPASTMSKQDTTPVGGSSGLMQVGAKEPESPVKGTALSTTATTAVEMAEHRELVATDNVSRASEGIIYFDDTERAVTPKVQTVIEPPQSRVHDTERTVAPKVAPVVEPLQSRVHDTERAITPKVQPMVQPLQSRLQQVIATACHKPVGDVQVTVLSAGKLEVRVKASIPQECDGLSKQIFQLPELTPYQVSLEIPVAQ